MLKYVGKRLLMMIPVLLGVTFIIFSMLYITPGDPARLVLGDSASPEAVEQYREEQGLNDPFLVQYGRYMKNLILHGDLGTSYSTKKPVIDLIKDCFPATVKLAFCSMLFALVLGIPIGIISAIKQYSIFDMCSMAFALLGISMPVFWLGLLLTLLFSVKLGWLPSSGFNTPLHLILPAVSLGAQSVAVITRMTRSS